MRRHPHGKPCARCGIRDRMHFRPPRSCRGFVPPPAPFPVALVEAAALDGVRLLVALPNRILKKKGIPL